jgi:hypothetical protein
MGNEIQKTEATAIQQVQPDHSPIPIDAPLMTRLAMMMERGIKIDTDQMSKMIEIAERLKATAAKEAYAADFAVVQANIDAAVKTAYNPQTKSNYAKLEGVIEASKPAYTAQGFSVVFSEGETEKPDHIRVCADVLHRDGHKESSHYDVPLGGVGIAGKVNMTAIHAKATSVTYGRRYLLCMIWNIPTQDDDGNAPDKKPPTVRPPTDEEWEVIAKVCNAITCPDGMRADAKKVAAVCFETWQIYPYSMDRVGKVVKLLDAMDRPELFIPDNRSNAEKQLDLPGDEDSQPDTEAPSISFKCNACIKTYWYGRKEGVGVQCECGNGTLEETDPRDRAIRESEATAAAKFGKENEQVELRYYCTKCDQEFEELKIKGVCPNSDCLSRDVIDRRPNG